MWWWRILITRPNRPSSSHPRSSFCCQGGEIVSPIRIPGESYPPTPSLHFPEGPTSSSKGKGVEPPQTNMNSIFVLSVPVSRSRKMMTLHPVCVSKHIAVLPFAPYRTYLLKTEECKGPCAACTSSCILNTNLYVTFVSAEPSSAMLIAFHIHHKKDSRDGYTASLFHQHTWNHTSNRFVKFVKLMWVIKITSINLSTVCLLYTSRCV